MDNLLIIIILAIAVNNTIADESTCTNDNSANYYQTDQFHCNIYTTICKNLISSTSLVKDRKSCSYNRICNELIISDSFLTIFNDKIIDFTSFCKIVKLTINASRITSISDETFYSLPYLQFLNLDNNEIEYLTFLSDLINLNFLSLERNNLHKIDAKDFRQLRKLQKLNLAHNNIQTLGDSPYLLDSLKELYLNNNNITTIKSNLLSKLTRLEILNLANNEIKFIDGNLLEPLILLRYVNFENNKVHAINDWVFSKSIRELYLRNNLLSFPNKETISIKNHMLQLIDISGCIMKTLENIFTSVASISILRISNCSINEIRPFAFSSLNKLISLDLSKNNLSSLRLNYFSGLENLQELSLTQNPIKTIFYESFPTSAKLITLNITVENFTLTNYTFKRLISLNTLEFVDSNILKVTNGSFSSYKHLTSVKLINTTLLHIKENGFANKQSIRCISSICESNPYIETVLFNLSGLSIQTIDNYGFQSVNRRTSFYFNYNNISTISKNLFFNSVANIISFNHSGIRNIEPNAFHNIYFNCYSNCYQFEKSIFINNNNISIIKHNSFGNITNLNTLIMRNNGIQIIEKYAFDKLEFTKQSSYYTIIDFSNNLLSIIQNNTFVGIKNVHIVVLDNNIIKKIIPGAFNTLIGTYILKLSYNDLNVIEENIFVGLDNLQKLYLDNNKLQTLMFNSFNSLESLKELKLNNNQLKSIPLGTFRNVHSLNVLMLNENNLSKLTTGVFTNLIQLSLLNLGNNNFSILNNNVFHPLIRLEVLYINNNSIFDVDYVWLKSHCLSLNRISLNFNNFNCTFLRNMLHYFRNKNINYGLLTQDNIYHNENIDGIMCFENESLVESEKSRNKSHNLQHNIFSININQNEKDNSNEIKLENILKNISTNLFNKSSEFMKNMTDFINSSILIMTFKSDENILTAEKESREFIRHMADLFKKSDKNNSDSGSLVFISMTAFAILLLLLIKLTFNKTYFYRIKSAICRKRKTEIELIDTSEN